MCSHKGHATIAQGIIVQLSNMPSNTHSSPSGIHKVLYYTSWVQGKCTWLICRGGISKKNAWYVIFLMGYQNLCNSMALMIYSLVYREFSLVKTSPTPTDLIQVHRLTSMSMCNSHIFSPQGRRSKYALVRQAN